MRLKMVITAILFVALITPAFADEIHFTNGDKLTGKLKHLVDGELVFVSDLAGQVKVKVVDLRLISTDSEVEIHIVDGRVVIEKLYVVSDYESGVAEITDLMGKPVLITEISIVNPPPKPKPRWKGNVTTGSNSTSGNSNSNNVNVGFNLKHDAGRNRITTKGGYNYGRQKDEETDVTSTTKNSWFLEGQYDHFYKEKSFIYTNARIGQDQVADLDLRTILGFGFGHQWIETDDMKFSMSGGLAWLREVYTEDENNSDLSAQLAYKLEKKINGNLSFIHDLTYFPVIEDLDDFFLTSQAELKSTLTSNMFASFKIVLDYDSTPAESAERTDLQYILGLGFTLD